MANSYNKGSKGANKDKMADKKQGTKSGNNRKGTVPECNTPGKAENLDYNGNETSGIFDDLTNSYLMEERPFTKTDPESGSTQSSGDAAAEQKAKRMDDAAANNIQTNDAEDAMNEWRKHAKEILETPVSGDISPDVRAIKDGPGIVSNDVTVLMRKQVNASQDSQAPVEGRFQEDTDAVSQEQSSMDESLPLGEYISGIGDGEMMVIPYKRRGLGQTRKNVNEARKIFGREEQPLKERKAVKHCVTDLTQDILMVGGFGNASKANLRSPRVQRDTRPPKELGMTFDESVNSQRYQREQDLIEQAKKSKRENINKEIEVEYLENDTKGARKGAVSFLLRVLTCGVYK